MEWHGIAVARNMHDGECGAAYMISYHKPFTSPADATPRSLGLPSDVKSERCYDLKGIEYTEGQSEPFLFWNVAGDAPKPTIDKTTIDSQRDW